MKAVETMLPYMGMMGGNAGVGAIKSLESAIPRARFVVPKRAAPIRRLNKAEQLRQNRAEGRRRENRVQRKLEGKFRGASVQREQYLRDSSGKIVKDPVTGKGRRIDHVVIRDGEVLHVVETTSKTSNKFSQLDRERRIRQEGGIYIRDRTTGKIIRVDHGPTRTIRVK